MVGLSCERMDRNMALYFSASPPACRFCRHYMKWLHLLVAEDGPSRESLAARATAEQYDRPRVTDGFFDLYNQLCSLVSGRGQQPALAPAFYSTLGNRFGHEI